MTRVTTAVKFSDDYENSFAAAAERGAEVSFDVRHGLEANDAKPVFAPYAGPTTPHL